MTEGEMLRRAAKRAAHVKAWEQAARSRRAREREAFWRPNAIARFWRRFDEESERFWFGVEVWFPRLINLIVGLGLAALIVIAAQWAVLSSIVLWG